MTNEEIEKAIAAYPKAQAKARAARRKAKRYEDMGVTDPEAYEKRIRAEKMREWRAKNPERAEQLRAEGAAREKLRYHTDPAYHARKAAQQKKYAQRQAVKKAQQLHSPSDVA